jgi:beta-glucuronidase
MYAFSKQLDPGRYVTFADDVIAFADPASEASQLVDFIMWNEYFGSWDGPESLLPAAIEKINKGYPEKMVLVTEFGYPGVFAIDSVTADRQREQIIRQQLPLLAKQDWIGGALLWCYQDYQSFHNLRPGQSDHYVDHGVVDKDRQRRPSYYVWQEMNAPAHVDLVWAYDEKGIPAGFRASVRRRSEQEIPSYPLVDYVLEWRLLDSAGTKIAGNVQTLAPMGPDQAVEGTWPAGKSQSLRLELVLYRPTGFVALRKTLTWLNPRQLGLTPQDFDRSAPTIP